MKKKFYIFITVATLFIIFIITNQKTSNVIQFQKNSYSPSNIINPEYKIQNRSISSTTSNTSITQMDETKEFKIIKIKFNESVLTKKQIKAVYDLAEFQQDMPVFNLQNIKRRDKFFEILNHDTSLVTESFAKILSDPSIKSDDLSLFLLNTMNLLDLNDQQKSQLIVARFSKNLLAFNNDATVADSDLSVIIGLSILANLKDQSTKEQAIDEIISNLGSNYNANYRKLLIEYLPDFKSNIRNI